jgi:hypothetical protein
VLRLPPLACGLDPTPALAALLDDLQRSPQARQHKFYYYMSKHHLSFYYYMSKHHLSLDIPQRVYHFHLKLLLMEYIKWPLSPQLNPSFSIII